MECKTVDGNQITSSFLPHTFICAWWFYKSNELDITALSKCTGNFADSSDLFAAYFTLEFTNQIHLGLFKTQSLVTGFLLFVRITNLLVSLYWEHSFY